MLGNKSKLTFTYEDRFVRCIRTNKGAAYLPCVLQLLREQVWMLFDVSKDMLKLGLRMRWAELRPAEWVSRKSPSRRDTRRRGSERTRQM